MTTRVNLTGTISVSHAGDEMRPEDMSGVIGRMILVRLSRSNYAISRTALVDDLWEGLEPQSVDSVLDATCSRLRKALTHIGLPAKEILISTGGLMQLRWPVATKIDFSEATRFIDNAEGTYKRGDFAVATKEATIAYSIAQRPLLPGINREWLIRDRSHLRSISERSVQLLCDSWREQGDLQSSLLMANKLMELTPYSEVAIRKLICSYVSLGDKAAATKVLNDWKTVLAKELQIIETREIEDF